MATPYTVHRLILVYGLTVILKLAGCVHFNCFPWKILPILYFKQKETEVKVGKVQ